jgi:hypothetical protein
MSSHASLRFTAMRRDFTNGMDMSVSAHCRIRSSRARQRSTCESRRALVRQRKSLVPPIPARSQAAVVSKSVSVRKYFNLETSAFARGDSCRTVANEWRLRPHK